MTKENKDIKLHFFKKLLLLTLILLVLLSIPVLLILKDYTFFNTEEILSFIVTPSVAAAIAYLLASGNDNSKHEEIVNKDEIYIEWLKELSVEGQLCNSVAESKFNTERLYSRSSFCLVVGCIISILGVFVFYLLNIGTDYNGLEISV